MKYLKYLAPLFLLAILLTVWGCERKIVVEDNSGDNGGGTELVSCFGCHSDQDLAVRHARDEWAISNHGTGSTVERNRVDNSFYSACERCHTQEGFLAFISDTEVEPPYHFSHIGCFTCHAPHTNGDLRLRVETAVTMEDGSTFDKGKADLCVTCHHSRSDVATTAVAGVELNSHWGTHHSVQGDMLNGTNGYEYAGTNYTSSPHTTVAADGCVDCHMASSGSYAGAGVGGHTWNMVDEANGIENLAGCNVTGCHGGSAPLDSLNRIAKADFDGDGVIKGTQDEIEGLVEDLAALLTAQGVLEDGEPASVTVDDAGLAGAVWNYVYVKEDRSMGIHNTAYAVELLQSSIDYVESLAAKKSAVVAER